MKYLVGLTFGLGLACGTGEGEYENSQYREDAIECEEAVAHVLECCAISVPANACEFHHLVPKTCGGCSSNHGTNEHDDMHPVLPVSTSEGFIAASCEDLSGNGGCATIEAMLAQPHGSSDPGRYDCY